MGCIPAKTCRNALTEANFFWPNRVRISDGICGDEAHQRRKSDHNTGNAFDFTHDPFNGLDTYSLARMLAEAKDPRVKYIISNGMIYSRRLGIWKWRKYYGSNKHTQHMHVSINSQYRDSPAGWWGRFMPKEIEMLTKDEHEAVMTANHFVKVIWPKELKPVLLQLAKDVAELKAKVGE